MRNERNILKCVVSLILVLMLWGCKSSHEIKMSVADETPQRTELTLQPRKTTLSFAAKEEVPQGQIRVISWMYLQQQLYDDYIAKLDYQQEIQKAERWLYAWLAILLCFMLGGLGVFYLYLQYLLKRREK